jgi:hypothetical protein
MAGRPWALERMRDACSVLVRQKKRRRAPVGFRKDPDAGLVEHEDERA